MSRINEYTLTMGLLFALLISVVVFLGALFIDMTQGESRTVTGEIVHLTYVPDDSGYKWGYGIDANGEYTYGWRYTREPAKYIVTVEVEGKVTDIHVSRSYFMSLEDGESIPVIITTGKYSGGSYYDIEK